MSEDGNLFPEWDCIILCSRFTSGSLSLMLLGFDLVLEAFNIRKRRFENIALSIRRLKLIRRSWDTIFPSRLYSSCMRIADRCQEIGCCPPGRTFKSQIFKVDFRFFSMTKERALSTLDENDLIKKIEKIL